MPGESDQIYVEARRALLDALEALRQHARAVILIGAQAIYLHTGDADLAVAVRTKDGDLVIDPRMLSGQPTIEAAMLSAGFRLGANPGVWTAASTSAQVDLLVPDGLAFGTGRRDARIPGHGASSTRRVVGLEPSIVDSEERMLTALDPRDRRTIQVRVAGPAALLVAKLHKVGERRATPDRLLDKDALDIHRILVALPTATLAIAIRGLLADQLSATVTREALAYLADLFATADATGSRMAGRAVTPLMDGNTVAQGAAALANDLLAALE